MNLPTASDMTLPGSDLVKRVKPKLRGYVHQYAFFVALALGVLLAIFADGATARTAAIIYSLSLAGLLGTSALYHRVTWSEVARTRMRKLDHSMIFVMIAGTTTPIALLAVKGTLGIVLLSLVWGVAIAGTILNLAWISAPKPVTASIYVVAGLLGVMAVGQLAGTVGLIAVGCLAFGGLLYIIGAAIYATEKPDPFPTVFGYHEIFHVLVVVAAAIHFGVIAGWVVPLSA
ncbi:MAG: hemolysin III family protein [Solirubrobacterales bacterium]|nr:hemolysin III family protein [Solirubrobacterales bacterium]